MALSFYDVDQVVYPNLPVVGTESARFGPARSFFDGRLGGSYEQVVYLRNSDATNYYTDILMSFEQNLYYDTGEFGNTGWGVKCLYGERRPTEAEWDAVRAGEPTALPDIGSTLAADTSTYHPVWIRVFCPGDTAAQLRDNQRLRLSYNENKVGA